MLTQVRLSAINRIMSREMRTLLPIPTHAYIHCIKLTYTGLNLLVLGLPDLMYNMKFVVQNTAMY